MMSAENRESWMPALFALLLFIFLYCDLLTFLKHKYSQKAPLSFTTYAPYFSLFLCFFVSLFL